MKFSYPIRRDYPWRYFTPATLTLSALVFAVLTVINVIAVGYETVTLVRDNFNATQMYWWSSTFLKPKPTCDAHQFNYGDNFFTNVSIFQYNIDFIEPSNGFLYSGAPLGAICSSVYYGVKVDATQMSVKTLAGLTCHGNNATAYIILSYVTNTLVDGRRFSKSSSSVGMSLLDSLAFDLLIGVLAESTTPTTTINILEAGAVTCDGFGPITDTSITPAQATACANSPVPLFITDIVFTYTNHSLNWISPSPPTDYVADLPTTLTDSIPNYLRAASAVILMDMGIWNNNSILVSPAIFNATITPNTAITDFLHQNPSFSSLSSVSSASLLRADPSAFTVPVGNRTTAAIAMSYVCHDQQRKSIFSFIISVIVADMSMFSAFWGAFMAIASYFASRKDADIQKSPEEQSFMSVDGLDKDDSS